MIGVALRVALLPGLLVGSALGPAGAAADETLPEARRQAPGPGPLLKAVLAALEQRGFGPTMVTVTERRVTTLFAPLDLETLRRVTQRADGKPEEPWAGGEYRYAIELLTAADRTRVAIGVEIRAWTRGGQSRTDAEGRQIVSSNRRLERELMEAFHAALADTETAE